MDVHDSPMFDQYHNQFSDFFDSTFLSNLRLFLMDSSHLSVDHVIHQGLVYRQITNEKYIFDESAENLIYALKSIGVTEFFVAEIDYVIELNDFGIVRVSPCVKQIEELQHPYAVTDHWNTIWFSRFLNFLILRPCTYQTPLYFVGSEKFIELMEGP